MGAVSPPTSWLLLAGIFEQLQSSMASRTQAALNETDTALIKNLWINLG